MGIRPVYLVLTLAALGFTSLGVWQLDRAAQRQHEIELIEQRLAAAPFTRVTKQATDLAHRRVELRGRFEPGWRVLIDNKVRNGQLGYEVIGLFRQEDGSPVLVNRGWLAAGPDRRELPAVPLPEDGGMVSGRLASWPSRPPFTGTSPQGDQPGVWNYLDFGEAEQLAGTALPAVLVLQTGAGDSLHRDWPLPTSKAGMHIGYAIQWFAFAAVAMGTMLVLGRRRKGLEGAS